jgi:hypothetical protein
MDALPFRQKPSLMSDRLAHQSPEIGPSDADAVDELWPALCAYQVDLRLALSGYVQMGWLVILRVDHEPEAARTVDDNHG